MKRTLLPLLAILTLCTALTGCGGTSDKEQFIEEADARCRTAAERVRQDTSAVGGDQFARVQASLSATEALVAELQALPGPRDDPKLSVVLTSYQSLVNEYRAAVAARQARDATAERRALTQIPLLEVQLEKQAEDYGLKECGRQST